MKRDVWPTIKCYLGFHDDEAGEIVRAGYVQASDEMANYFWTEEANVRKCRRCNKEVTWSRRFNGWERT